MSEAPALHRLHTCNGMSQVSDPMQSSWSPPLEEAKEGDVQE